MEDVKIKTFFDIPPRPTGRCMFQGIGFNLNDIRMVDKCAQAGSSIDHRFSIYIGSTDEYKIEFCFSRAKDARDAQEELVRAWMLASNT